MKKQPEIIFTEAYESLVIKISVLKYKNLFSDNEKDFWKNATDNLIVDLK